MCKLCGKDFAPVTYDYFNINIIEYIKIVNDYVKENPCKKSILSYRQKKSRNPRYSPDEECILTLRRQFVGKHGDNHLANKWNRMEFKGYISKKRPIIFSRKNYLKESFKNTNCEPYIIHRVNTKTLSSRYLFAYINKKRKFSINRTFKTLEEARQFKQEFLNDYHNQHNSVAA